MNVTFQDDTILFYLFIHVNTNRQLYRSIYLRQTGIITIK